MVEGIVGANLLRAFELLHIVDLGARHLVGVLDRALALLLVPDRLRDALLHCVLLRSRLLISVTLVRVLVTGYINQSSGTGRCVNSKLTNCTLVSARIVYFIVTDCLWTHLLGYHHLSLYHFRTSHIRNTLGF